MTNMDALTIPAAGGVDSTALIVGDFSNGNDGVVLKGADKSLADIRGQNVNLVELSVSHYLLARALASADMTERDLTVVNTSDADIVAAFSTDDVTSVVTWNPLLAEITAMPDVSPAFDSSMIPGEIIDMLVVSTEAADDPRLGKALVGAWYETMAAMSAEGADADAAKTHMAVASGTGLAGYNASWPRRRCSLPPHPPWSSCARTRWAKPWRVSLPSRSSTPCSAKARRTPDTSVSSFRAARSSVPRRTSSCASPTASCRWPPTARRSTDESAREKGRAP